ncbi:MAG TPA: lipopolysaccharide heptosyltransferase II [Nitrospirota bacterium]
MDNRRLERVLIIKPSSLGDVIHALPVASALRKALPGVKVDWVVSSAYAGLLEGNPDISRVIIFDRGMLRGADFIAKLLGLLSELRRERYDAVLDLQGLLRSGLMAFAARSGTRVGFANAREGATLFYSVKAPVPDINIHAVDRYMSVLSAVGVRPADAEFTLTVMPEDDAQAVDILNGAGIKPGERFIAAAPSARWETKRWPAARFVELARGLYEETGIKTVFVGTASDAELFTGLDLGDDLKGSSVFGKTSIRSLAALFKRAVVVVTNDSGPMHIAAAAGTPTVAIFGPTDPVRTGPYGKAHRVVASGIECVPCLKRNCETVRCLTGISTGQVMAEVMAIIKGETCR